MNLALTVLIAGVATSFADWLFFGVLFHDRYRAYPEVWRRTMDNKQGGIRAIVQASLVALLTPVVFVVLCAFIPVSGAKVYLLALALWIMIPVPLLVGNHLFIKLHPLILVAHGLGWLAKLLLCAASVTLFAHSP